MRYFVLTVAGCFLGSSLAIALIGGWWMVRQHTQMWEDVRREMQTQADTIKSMV